MGKASFAFLFAAVCVGCSCENDSSGDPLDGSGGDMDASNRNDGSSSDGDGAANGPDGTILGPDGSLTGDTQCTNGVDDDGDGNTDGFDPECTGPGDNDEGSFATGIPGDNRDPNCQDCFFDGNSGSGDDQCRYATTCLTTGEPTSGNGSCGVSCDASEVCVQNCQPSTPNGCDCFGCCSVFLAGGTSVDILLSATCSLDDIEDEAACPRCMKDTSCENSCDRCELCYGRTPADLPADCGASPDGGRPDGGVPYTCSSGTACASDNDCGIGEYCSLGCCLIFLD